MNQNIEQSNAAQIMTTYLTGVSPHSSSGASSLLSQQSLLPSHTSDSGTQFPLVQVKWFGLHVLIISSAQ